MTSHTGRPRVRLLAAGAIAGLALTLAACSSGSTTSSGYGGSAPPVTTPTTAAASGTVTVQDTTLGEVLADGQGMTLYMLTSDPKNGSGCTGQCATAWPPLIAQSAPADPAGSTAKFTVFKRSDGTMQVAANGQALYTFQSDTAPGDVNGQGVKAPSGTWYAVGASGASITSQ